MDQRDDAPKFDLSARPADAEEALLLNPSDLNAPAVSANAPKAGRPRVKKNKPSKTAQAGLDAKLFEALVGPVAPVTMSRPSALKSESSPPFDVTPEPLMAGELSPRAETPGADTPISDTPISATQATPTLPAEPEKSVEEEKPIPVEVYDGPDADPEIPPAMAAQERIEAEETDEADLPPPLKMFPTAPVAEPPVMEVDWEPLPPVATQSVMMRYVPAEYDEPKEEPVAAYQAAVVPVENTVQGLVSPPADPLALPAAPQAAPVEPETPIAADEVTPVVEIPVASTPAPVVMLPESMTPAAPISSPGLPPEPFEVVGLPPVREAGPSAPEPFEIVVPSPVPPARRFYDPAAIEEPSVGEATPPKVTPNKPIGAKLPWTVIGTRSDAARNKAADETHDDAADVETAVFAPESEAADEPTEAEEEAEAWAEPAQGGDLAIAGALTEISAEPTPRGRTGAWWTIPLLCAGLAIVACAVLVPAADENRRAMHELAKIEQDVSYFQKQSEVNKEFLERVATDPTLAERLAMRQLRLTRANSRMVQLHGKADTFSMSPYALVSIDPPTPLPEYRSITGFISKYFLDTRGQIYLAGLGMLMAAAGVILGGGTAARKPGVQTPRTEPVAEPVAVRR